MTDTIIKSVVIWMYEILITLIIISTIASLIFEVYYRRKRKIIRFVEENLHQMITQRVDLIYDCFPDEVMYLKYMLPAIQKFDALFRDPFWEYLKRQLIGKHLAKQIYYSLHSLHWGKANIALQAIKYLPQPKYEDKVLEFLKAKKKDIIRFSAAECASQYNTKKSIRALIDALSEEPVKTQFPFRDPLVYSGEATYKTILEYYKETKSIKIKVACLKILSLKVGYLSLQDVQDGLGSSNLEMRFWSLRALENIPCEETDLCLVASCEDKHWVIRSLVAFIYGSSRISTGLERLPKLLNDEHYYVSFLAALSLNAFGKKGKEILSSTPQSNERVYRNCQYILTLPETSFEKGLQKFFPINQDPLTIIEAII